MVNQKSICAVIVSYEPDEAIIRLYDSVCKQVDEVIIVDNASSCKTSCLRFCPRAWRRFSPRYVG